MAINFSPKIGQLLECDYGAYSLDRNGNFIIDMNRVVPPEMIKRRPVIVLNAKLSSESCLVVPLSSKKNTNLFEKGIHVEFAVGVIPALDSYEQITSWAKCDMMSTVSKKRLHSLLVDGVRQKSIIISSEFITKIQIGVIKSISAGALIK